MGGEGKEGEDLYDNLDDLGVNQRCFATSSGLPGLAKKKNSCCSQPTLKERGRLWTIFGYLEFGLFKKKTIFFTVW